ncbi:MULTISPECIES: WhiB family transcriptional regulator [Streptomycetaceae]|uniref:WhiB family transcriptional regulator n=1 Tax=Streptomycetaceae TaxID=2062 RepID=UPI003009083F
MHSAPHDTSGLQPDLTGTPTGDLTDRPPLGSTAGNPSTDPPEKTLLPLTELDDEIERLGVPVPCRTYDPEVFFAESPADVEYAKSLCQTCPVREACLAGAKDRREPWGVWGGELFIQGVVVPRKRPRGRPRKNAVAA